MYTYCPHSVPLPHLHALSRPTKMSTSAAFAQARPTLHDYQLFNASVLLLLDIRIARAVQTPAFRLPWNPLDTLHENLEARLPRRRAPQRQQRHGRPADISCEYFRLSSQLALTWTQAVFNASFSPDPNVRIAAELELRKVPRRSPIAHRLR